MPDPVPAALPPLRDVIARHGLGARRSLGQHFLLDGNLTARIVRAAGDLSAATVIEVGPGPGGLTRALLAADARHVVAIELDGRCIDALAELAEAYPGRLTVVEGDALEFDVVALARNAVGTSAGTPLHIVANLPYNVSTVLLLSWLRQAMAFSGMTLMFQKEVAERLTAAAGSASYGRLTVITRWLCETARLFDVPPQAFVPPPKVTSTVVRLVPRAAPLAPARFETLERVTAAAFGQRRKMLRSALRTLGPDPAALLAEAGIDPTLRAETLTVGQFCALARALDSDTMPRDRRSGPASRS